MVTLSTPMCYPLSLQIRHPFAFLNGERDNLRVKGELTCFRSSPVAALSFLAPP
jgi:hypothetical protein